MHVRLFVTCNKENAETSEEARSYVYEELAKDGSFVSEGGRFASPICDWFVIGGRWSGELSRSTWAKSVEEQIAALEKQEGIKIWGYFYGSEESREKQKALKEKVEALYQQALPDDYQGKGLVYDRDSYTSYGYEDDAMIVTSELYEAVLKPYEGYDEYGGEFVDLDYDEVNPQFINTKWLVVVDYHI